jgi:hypothetical protein
MIHSSQRRLGGKKILLLPCIYYLLVYCTHYFALSPKVLQDPTEFVNFTTFTFILLLRNILPKGCDNKQADCRHVTSSVNRILLINQPTVVTSVLLIIVDSFFNFRLPLSQKLIWWFRHKESNQKYYLQTRCCE